MHYLPPANPRYAAAISVRTVNTATCSSTVGTVLDSNSPITDINSTSGSAAVLRCAAERSGSVLSTNTRAGAIGAGPSSSSSWKNGS
ncbi:hypothetical protein NJ76_04675 [Rhodococcus sp. IITR03]|nr:hypothetical protein NJ76_04675 [Rhodococcus sp. IITR03]